jgi:hypothetical protein
MIQEPLPEWLDRETVVRKQPTLAEAFGLVLGPEPLAAMNREIMEEWARRNPFIRSLWKGTPDAP